MPDILDFLPEKKRKKLLQYPFITEFLEGKLTRELCLQNLEAFEEDFKEEGITEEDIDKITAAVITGPIKAINNVEAGRQFASLARVILEEERDIENKNYWFSDANMQDIAEVFNIFGIFMCFERDHWLLVLQFVGDKRFKVYDPLKSKNGKHIYTFILPPEKKEWASVSVPRSAAL